MVLNKHIRDKYPNEVIEAANKQKNDLFLKKNQSKSVDPQLAEFFVKDAKKTISILEALYANKCRRGDDISVFIINVHAMKSALANINETDLSAEAAKLEQAGREQNIKLILSELPIFLEQLYAVVDKLEPKEEAQANSDVEDNIPYLKEKLEAVRAACDSFNKKAAKDALAEIKQETWSQSVKDQLSEISGLLLHSEFDEAVKVIDEYLQSLS
jgi:HPt (histidine-containing phosphotransfer) domain-containing protein